MQSRTASSLTSQTPDTGSGRVGVHPIFPELRTQAAAILAKHENLGWKLSARWEAERFLEWCDEARAGRSPEAWEAASEIQNIECRLLFDWCVGPMEETFS